MAHGSDSERVYAAIVSEGDHRRPGTEGSGHCRRSAARMLGWQRGAHGAAGVPALDDGSEVARTGGSGVSDLGSPCIPWTGHINRDGYGWTGRALAHRWAWLTQVGPIRDGLALDHLCHGADALCMGGRSCLHRRCINVAHLEPVTGATNVQRSRHARLTEGDVAAIRIARRTGAGVRALGRQYGVHHSQISRLLNGHHWIDVGTIAT